MPPRFTFSCEKKSWKSVAGSLLLGFGLLCLLEFQQPNVAASITHGKQEEPNEQVFTYLFRNPVSSENHPTGKFPSWL